MPTVETIPCKTCGQPFERVVGGSGLTALHCPGCRKPSGKNRNPKANALRHNRSRRAKKASPEDHDLAVRLAAAMALYADPRAAAEWAGLEIGEEKVRCPLDGQELRRIAALARDLHPDIIDGKPVALSRRLLSIAHLVAQDLVTGTGKLSSRDAPHVLRALANARDQIMPDTQELAFASVSVGVTVLDDEQLETFKRDKLRLVS